jgi:hypothetical protein
MKITEIHESPSNDQTVCHEVGSKMDFDPAKCVRIEEGLIMTVPIYRVVYADGSTKDYPVSAVAVTRVTDGGEG